MITINFPKNYERCFDYNSDPTIISELENIFRDAEVLALFEEKIIIDFHEESFSVLFRCHHSKRERDNELEGLSNNRVYTTCKYYHKREEGYVSKTYGPGAYYLEEISDYVYENKPFCFKVLFDSNVYYTTVTLSEELYNKYIFIYLY